MKNKDLFKYKVLINPNLSNGKYQEIALLVDQPRFISKLIEARIKAKIEKPFIDLKQIETINKYPSYSELSKKYEEIREKDQAIKYRIGTSSLEILFELHYPMYYRDVVKHAIVFGLVVDLQPVVTLIDNKHKIQNPSVIMIPSPTTTNEEIKKALTEAKILINRTERTKTPNNLDTTSNIKKYRYWYWEYLSGKDYKIVSDEWADNPQAKENDPGFDANFVYKGIQSYKERLLL